jgi:hypothetical protein
MNNEQRRALIGEIYDFIADTITKQGRLLPVKTLYGDGSRFKNEWTIFETTYKHIKITFFDNNKN